MKNLNIVIVMVEPPLPFGNAAARWFYVLLKGLVERGHKVRAFAVCTKEEEMEKAKKLFPADKYDLRLFPIRKKSNIPQKLKTLFRPYSFKISPEMQRELDVELAKGYDILHIEQMWGGWAALKHLKKAILNIHHFQMIDLEFTNESNFKERLEKWLIVRAEKTVTKKFKYIRTCSPRLEVKARELSPTSYIFTNPVGMDHSLYEYIKDEERGSEPTIVLIGTMTWYPTSSAARRLLDKLWPEIKKQVPEAKLKIVGYDACSVLKEYINSPGIEIFENVPEIEPYFKMGSVFVYAPGRGSGMKIKILEAMLFGIPVVTTSEGSEGLPAQDGVHLGLCEDDEGLISRTVELLRDTVKQNEQREHARKLVEDVCGPEATLNKMIEMYNKIQE